MQLEKRMQDCCSPCDALACRRFTPEGGELFLSSKNGGIWIPEGAFSENVLVVIGGGTKIEIAMEPENICDDEGFSVPCHMNISPFFTTLPDKYLLNTEATIFFKKPAYVNLNTTTEEMLTETLSEEVEGEGEEMLTVTLWKEGEEGQRDTLTDVKINNDSNYFMARIQHL